MIKEVTKIPQGKDFLEFFEEKFEGKLNESWFYVDQSTIDILRSQKKQGIPSYVDTKSRLHVSYGNIILDGYRFDDYEWYRIHSICAENVAYRAVADPKEIFFISIQ